MRSDKRIQKNLGATLVARDLLKSIVRNPEKYSEEYALISALKSQGGLAKLDYETEIDGEVVRKLPMSLNTLKNFANQEFDEGFEGINSLRLKAIDSVETFVARSVRPDSRSRVALQARIGDLEEELDKHRSTNFILLQALQSAMASIKKVKDEDDPALREHLAKEGLNRLRAITSLNPSPFDDTSRSTVVSLKDFKDDK